MLRKRRSFSVGNIGRGGAWSNPPPASKLGQTGETYPLCTHVYSRNSLTIQKWRRGKSIPIESLTVRRLQLFKLSPQAFHTSVFSFYFGPLLHNPTVDLSHVTHPSLETGSFSANDGNLRKKIVENLLWRIPKSPPSQQIPPPARRARGGDWHLSAGDSLFGGRRRRGRSAHHEQR